MTTEERIQRANAIYQDAIKRIQDECGCIVIPALSTKTPSAQYLAVEPVIQIQEIAGWVAPKTDSVVSNERR
jgi:hypothetical protein